MNEDNPHQDDVLEDEGNRQERRERLFFFREAVEVIKILIISLAIVVPIRYFVVQPFIVRGASMEPNFEDSQYLIIDELSYYLREAKRGESIVFRYPKDPDQFFIKRIIGLPGERMEINDGAVWIFSEAHPAGFVLEEPYLAASDRRTKPDMEIELGPDEYFVLGDNRDFSSDSRVWGALGRRFIVGRAAFRAWPLGEIGVVGE